MPSILSRFSLRPRIGLAVTAARAHRFERPFIGGELAAGFVFGESRTFLSAGARFAWSGEEGLSVREARGMLDVGIVIRIASALQIEPSVGIIVDQVSANATVSETSQALTELSLGGRALTQLVVTVAEPFQLLLGAELVLADAILIKVENEVRGRLPALRLGLTLGMRWSGSNDHVQN